MNSNTVDAETFAGVIFTNAKNLETFMVAKYLAQALTINAILKPHTFISQM